jgi:hypothetical protein
MIKFLFYLFLIYLVYRLLFGRFMGGSIRTKVFHNNVHHHYHQKEQQEPEGRVTVDPKIKNKQNGTPGKIGEYVDYEEIN